MAVRDDIAIYRNYDVDVRNDYVIVRKGYAIVRKGYVMLRHSCVSLRGHFPLLFTLFQEVDPFPNRQNPSTGGCTKRNSPSTTV